MNEIEIKEFYENIEKKYDVKEWIIAGIRVWPFIKMKLYGQMLENNKKQNNSVKNNVLRRIKKIINKSGKICKAICSGYINTKRTSYDVLIWHHNVSRNVILNDSSRFDYNLDPFTHMLENDYDILSFDYLAGSRNVPPYRETLFVDCFLDKIKIQAKIRNIFFPLKDYRLDKYEEFIEELPLDFRPFFTEASLLKEVSELFLMSKEFEKIIIKNGIKFLIAGCGYGFDTMALFLACNKAKIKCMEVQHGLAAGDGHAWYSMWYNLPRNDKYELLPDIYWVWSEEDQKVMQTWCGVYYTVFMGRKPILSVMDWMEQNILSKPLLIDKDKHSVLYTLQTGIDPPEYIYKFIKDTASDYNWIIRRHPQNDEKQDVFINSVRNIEGVYVDTPDSVFLDSLLKIVDVHITAFSTVAIDALEHSIFSIILDKQYEPLFRKYIESGYMSVATNELQLQEIMNDIMAKKKFGLIKHEVCEYGKQFLFDQINSTKLQNNTNI